MNVADMAATRGATARRFAQGAFKTRLVDVADDFAYEVAAAHCAVAVHRDDRMAGATGPPQARMVLIVDRKERIDIGEAAQFFGVVIIRSPFVGVDPQINARRQFAPQRFDLFRVLFQADDAYAEAHACTNARRNPGRPSRRPDNNKPGRPPWALARPETFASKPAYSPIRVTVLGQLGNKPAASRLQLSDRAVPGLSAGVRRAGKGKALRA